METVHSIQEKKALMVVIDFILAKKRLGYYSFVANGGRINVSVSSAKSLQRNISRSLGWIECPAHSTDAFPGGLDVYQRWKR